MVTFSKKKLEIRDWGSRFTTRSHWGGGFTPYSLHELDIATEYISLYTQLHYSIHLTLSLSLSLSCNVSLSLSLIYLSIYLCLYEFCTCVWRYGPSCFSTHIYVLSLFLSSHAHTHNLSLRLSLCQIVYKIENPLR